MCHANNKKQKIDKWLKEYNYQIKKKIRTLGERETYKYLGILDADTIKQSKMKQRKNVFKIPQENQKTTRNQTTWQKSHQRDKYQGYPPHKILGTILNVLEKKKI